MFCYNCGSKLDDKAVICPHCGVQVRTLSDDPAAFGERDGKHPSVTVARSDVPPASAQRSANNENALAIVGFILAFFVPLAGLICSIIGLKKANQGAPYKGLAIAGVIISAIAMFFNLILVVSCTCAAIAAGAAAGATGPNVDYYYAVLSLL